MKVRVSEQQGMSLRTGKRLKEILSTSVRDHMLVCNNSVTWDDFKLLGKESNQWLLGIKESLFIKIIVIKNGKIVWKHGAYC